MHTNVTHPVKHAGLLCSNFFPSSAFNVYFSLLCKIVNKSLYCYGNLILDWHRVDQRYSVHDHPIFYLCVRNPKHTLSKVFLSKRGFKENMAVSNRSGNHVHISLLHIGLKILLLTVERGKSSLKIFSPILIVYYAFGTLTFTAN